MLLNTKKFQRLKKVSGTKQGLNRATYVAAVAGPTVEKGNTGVRGVIYDIL